MTIKKMACIVMSIWLASLAFEAVAAGAVMQVLFLFGVVGILAMGWDKGRPSSRPGLGCQYHRPKSSNLGCWPCPSCGKW